MWQLDPGRALVLTGPAVSDGPVATLGHVYGTAAMPRPPADSDRLARVIVDALNAAAEADHHPYPDSYDRACLLCGRAIRGGGSLPLIHAQVGP